MSLSMGSLRLAIAFAMLCAFALTQAFATTPEQTINLPEDGQVVVDDEQAPEVTARVARISLLNGTAKVRHAGSDEWEVVVLNLPVVEGDEIVTDTDSRLEIQFDKHKHLRLAGDSYLKVVGLKDDGIALSLPLGTMSVRIISFNKDKAFFEIDAPKTTIAVQDEGTYRVDSGRLGDTEIRVSVTNGGSARVYSSDAGFVLKNNRSARIYTDGPNVGESELADASRFYDEFDTWADERDSVIAQRLRDAHYDKYYDNDIYGADDLNDNGEWIYTRNYGYVWRPYRTATSRWVDWSPYRYGHWRWIPPYGWTWINDEPWGWATYHHGRWFFDDGFWYWSPYGYYRPVRSWWYPALVVINVFNNNVCWYPLPYHYNYYSYNCGRGRRCGGGHHGGGHNGGGNNGPNYSNAPTGGIKDIKPKTINIPPSSVVAMSVDDFGGVKGIKKAPLSLANTVIVKSPGEIKAPELPDYSPVKASPTIAVKTPKLVTASGPIAVKTGAVPRKVDVPMDNELRNTKIFNGRQPIISDGGTGGTKPMMTNTSPVRQTGAVDRQPMIKQNTTSDPPVKQAPTYSPPVKQPTVRQPPMQNDPPVRQQPTYSPPPVKQPVRQSPPSDSPPPVKQQPTRQPQSDPSPAPVKQAPPSRSEPVKQAPSPNRKVAGDGV